MVEDRVASLTESEREVLRLWLQLEAKEIAVRLGLTPTAVTERLRTARRRLNVSSSAEAARLLADYEEGAIPKRHVDMPQAIAGTVQTDIMAGSGSDGIGGSLMSEALREEQAPYAAPTPRRRGIRLPLRKAEGDGNDLNGWQSFGWVAVIAAGVPVLLGSLMVGLWVLVKIAAAIKASFL